MFIYSSGYILDVVE